MVFNSYQNIPLWEDYFDKPEGDRLGLLGALYQIGSVCSIPLVPIITDNWGRRLSIAVGFIIIVVGGILQGACQDYGSEFATCSLLPLRSVPLTDTLFSFLRRPCSPRFRQLVRPDCLAHASD
jgi:MFS family permease